MRKIRIKHNELVWDDWNIQHIRKHNVTKSEVEETLSQQIEARSSYNFRLMVFGKTKKKRLLAIVIKKTNKGYYIFSARDASRKEKQYV